MIRLQKLLAMAGAASRRKAEALILAGRVSVNGIVITELGAKASPGDALEIDGIPVETAQKKVYIMLHKPEGVVTTVTDPFNRPTVMDYIPKNERIFPVGRLDYNTSGLLLLTNDGGFAARLTHPKYHISKTYIAVVKGTPANDKLETLRTGITIDGRKTSPCEVKVLPSKDLTFNNPLTARIQITIYEGRNRQVRKMFEAVGHPVIRLKRVAVGKLNLGRLPRGKWRHLTPEEVQGL